MVKILSGENKIEYLEQYDYYDSDYIETRRKYIAPAIGNFLISFSEFEDVVNISLAELIMDRSHDIGYTIIRNMDVMEKVVVFTDLLYHNISLINPPNKTVLKQLKKTMIEIVEFRNKVAHANWNTLEKKDYVRVKIKPSKEDGFITFTKEMLSPKVINSYIKLMEKTCNDIPELIEATNQSL